MACAHPFADLRLVGYIRNSTGRNVLIVACRRCSEHLEIGTEFRASQDASAEKPASGEAA